MAVPDRVEVAEAAAEGVAFGYPLVVSGLLLDGIRGGGGPDVAACGPVTAVRADADGVDDDPLGLAGWMDLTAGPVVLCPDGAGRVGLLDGWSQEFASLPGGAGRHAVVGPYWHGSLPRGVAELRSPTAIVWVAAAPPVRRPRLTPLTDPAGAGGGAGGAGGPCTAPRVTPADRVAVMHPRVLFGTLGRLMADNPPLPADDPVVERIARIGVLIGEDYDWDALDRRTGADVLRGVRAGLDAVERAGRAARNGHGPDLPRTPGGFGTDYAARAGVALAALGLLRAPGRAGGLEA